MLKIGDKAADFSLLDKDGKTHKLSNVKSKYTIVYFYPRDNTPGCTVEAKKFTEALDEFEELGVTIIGISGGDEKSKTKFCEKHELRIILLSDPGFSVAEAYGSFGEKKFMGRTFLGIKRDTYLLDKNKKVIQIYRKVKPKDHIEQIMSDIKELEN